MAGHKPAKHRGRGEADGRLLKDPAIRVPVVIGLVIAGPVFFLALVLRLVLQVNGLVAVHFASRRRGSTRLSPEHSPLTSAWKNTRGGIIVTHWIARSAHVTGPCAGSGVTRGILLRAHRSSHRRVRGGHRLVTREHLLELG